MVIIQSPTLSGLSLSTLSDRFTGDLVWPDDAGYDRARALWNAAIDRRPAGIVRCATTQDVVAALRFTHENGLGVNVRGGGHSLSGLSSRDGALMIDLSSMRSVEVDVEGRRAIAGPGVLGADLDRATQAHGLAATLGTVSHTGIAGLTLGGGTGWLMRQHGLACDNLRSVEAVLADGRVVTASATQNSELFWALRGGGGQLAVVTRFEYELYPVGPEVSLVQMAFLPEDGPAALRAARDLGREASEDRTLMLCWTTLPDGEELPVGLRGAWVYVVMAFSTDPGDLDGAWVAGLDQHHPVSSTAEPTTYTEVQQMFDEDNAHGVFAYAKGAFVRELTDEAIEAFTTFAQGGFVLEGGVDALVYLQQMGGRVADLDVDSSAARGRDAEHAMNIICRWKDDDGSDPALCRDRTRSFIGAMAPFACATVPLNFEGDVDQSGGGSAEERVYGPGSDRMARVKRQVDPSDVFGSLRLGA